MDESWTALRAGSHGGLARGVGSVSPNRRCPLSVSGHGVGRELGSYRIEALLGRGGMGVVHLATDVRLGRRVALKLLAPNLADEERFRRRFLSESRLAASIDHANIVRSSRSARWRSSHSSRPRSTLRTRTGSCTATSSPATR
jgi:serine/threonine protein kinase